MSTDHVDFDALKFAVEHARAWMILHADQRLRALNFWIVAMAFLTAAYVSTVETEPAMASVVAALGALVSIGFQRLERRTRELVKLAEAALIPAEQRLANLTGIDALRLAQLSDVKREHFTSYAHVIMALQLIAIFGFVTASLVAYTRVR